MLSACKTKNVLLLILSECYYEEPYAGKPHVRICEGLELKGSGLLDYRAEKMFFEVLSLVDKLPIVVGCL